MAEYPKVFDYVNNVISLADKPEDFDNCNFAILCEKYPIQTNRNKYLAKVIYISIQSDKNTWRIYPNKIKEFEIEHVIISSNARRKLNYRMEEFWVNGSNETQEFKENRFYNYSIEIASHKTKTLITKLREKYNLEAPELFIGVSQPLILE